MKVENGVDTAENEPSKVFLGHMVPKWERHGARTGTGRQTSGSRFLEYEPPRILENLLFSAKCCQKSANVQCCQKLGNFANNAGYVADGRVAGSPAPSKRASGSGSVGKGSTDVRFAP